MLLALLATLYAEEAILLEDELEEGSVPVYGEDYLAEPAQQTETETETEAGTESETWGVIEAPVVEAPPPYSAQDAQRDGEALVENWPVAPMLGSAAASACLPVGGCLAVGGLSTIVRSPEQPQGMSDEHYELYRAAYKKELRYRRLMMAGAGGAAGSVVGILIWRELY